MMWVWGDVGVSGDVGVWGDVWGVMCGCGG